MNESITQLTLALFDAPRSDFADFHGVGNRVPAQALAHWATGELHWCLGLWGEAGVGKSHLLQAAIRRAHQGGMAAMYVPLREVLSYGPSVVENLEQIEAVAIDDLDLAAGNQAWELALFALYNRCAAANCRLLFAANAAPLSMAIQLPDLRSRLAAALIYHLSDPDDADKLDILRGLARDRGMELTESVAAFLMRRLPRTLPALVGAIETLDRLSLRAARPLTVPFVREALNLAAEE
jgi:DnaA-homolog protein